MRTLILTANFGGFDAKKVFPAQSLKCDFVAFDEANLPVPMTALDNRMKAKYFKLQTHLLFPDYEKYIWLDSSFQIKSEGFAIRMLAELEGNDIAVTKHPERNCIYKEAEFVLNGLKAGSKYFLSRYLHSQMEKEIELYRSQQYPENNGLFACGLFARNNDAKTNLFFDSWWNTCLQYSVFDQLSFPVLAKKQNIKIKPIVFDNYLNNQFYTLVKHTQIK